MPLTSANTRAQLADRARNPTRQVAASSNGIGGQLITINLILQGVPFNPEDVYDALTAKYGANKVTTDLDTAGQGVYEFRIIP